MRRMLKNNFLCSFLITTFLVISSGHALQTIFPKLAWIVIGVAFCISFFVIYRIFNNPLQMKEFVLLFLLFMTFFSGVFYFNGGLNFYLKFSACIFCAYFLSIKISFKVFVDCYLRFMTVTTPIAIICYYLLNYTSILNSLPLFTNINDVEYGVGIIFNYIVELPHRNCGMFWEPGIFATNIIIALVFEILYKNDKINWVRILIFSWGIITANSSAGFILLFSCLILYIVKRGGVNLSSPFGCLRFFVVAFAFVFVLNLENLLVNTSLSENPYIAKLFLENVESSSRYNALKHNLEIFWDFPIIGAGFAYTNQNMMYVADTSSFTYIMSVFGFLGIGYTVFWLYSLIKQKQFNFSTRIVLTMIFVIILNKEPQHSLLLSWCLLFYFIGMKPQTSVEGICKQK